MSIEQQLAGHLRVQAEHIHGDPSWAEFTDRLDRANRSRRRLAATVGIATVLAAAAIAIPLTSDGGQTVRTAESPHPGETPVHQDLWRPLDHRVTGELEVLQSGADAGVAWEAFAFPTNQGTCYGVRAQDPAQRHPARLQGFPAGSYRCLADVFASVMGAPVGLSAEPPKRDAKGLVVIAPFELRVLRAGEDEITLRRGDGSPSPLPVLTPSFDPKLRFVVIPPMPEGTQYVVQSLKDGKPAGSPVRNKADWNRGQDGQIRIVARRGGRLFWAGTGSRPDEACAGYSGLVDAEATARSLEGAPAQPVSGSGYGCGKLAAGQSWGVGLTAGITVPDAATLRVTLPDGAVIVTKTFGCDTGLDVCFFGVDPGSSHRMPVRVEGFRADGTRIFNERTDERLLEFDASTSS